MTTKKDYKTDYRKLTDWNPPGIHPEFPEFPEYMGECKLLQSMTIVVRYIYNGIIC